MLARETVCFDFEWREGVTRLPSMFCDVESHQLPRLCQKSDTTGFSRVEHQFFASQRVIDFLEDTTDFSRVEFQFLPFTSVD